MGEEQPHPKKKIIRLTKEFQFKLILWLLNVMIGDLKQKGEYIYIYTWITSTVSLFLEIYFTEF